MRLELGDFSHSSLVAYLVETHIAAGATLSCSRANCMARGSGVFFYPSEFLWLNLLCLDSTRALGRSNGSMTNRIHL